MFLDRIPVYKLWDIFICFFVRQSHFYGILNIYFVNVEIVNYLGGK